MCVHTGTVPERGSLVFTLLFLPLLSKSSDAWAPISLGFVNLDLKHVLSFIK